ncbi:hypothetical protein ACJRO7_030996 [Eucalyptus globulus]|uniref:Protein kinase domain-containing protein n=1 Tax=Eucalyptus globulus TaxID=34317 RepID=A0ABD3JIE8_EUCGL
MTLTAAALSLLLLPLLLLPPPPAAAAADPPLDSLLPSDAVALLSFKSSADLDNHLLFALNERFDFCQWRGVKCAQGRVVRLALPSSGLRGSLAAATLSRLDQLRVLTLHNNSLSGPLPDLSPLANLRSLSLGLNSFSGPFPSSLLSLRRLRVLDLGRNAFAGPIPAQITALDRLDTLLLDGNRFGGALPPLNQTLLKAFNVSGNNLTGPIPATPTLSRFDPLAFAGNPELCGEVINKACASGAPFFGPTSSGGNGSSSVPAPLAQSAQSQNGVVVSPASSSRRKPKRTGAILGFALAVILLVSALLIVFILCKTRKRQTRAGPKGPAEPDEPVVQARAVNSAAPNLMTELREKYNSKIQEAQQRVQRSGCLVFCAGESQLYTLEQLMRASAELLGRGTIGTTYKAVLDNQLIVTVKRLDAGKTAGTSEEVFEGHMDSVGWLRHPNLVPMRAFFQARGERLVVFDYQPNGSLYNLIHGSRSARAKPLHWTSCLKIAEDVAQGLAYLHQASRLIHGNLKSTNVLLGTDFEACLTDNCLAALAECPLNEDPDSAAYKAPESRKPIGRATPKSDVYSFGVLLLELLTGKHPLQHPFLAPTEMLDWVRAMREEDSEDKRLGMLVEVATVCRVTSPEQRPVMRQVLKMIQEIKEDVMMEENASVGYA